MHTAAANVSTSTIPSTSPTLATICSAAAFATDDAATASFAYPARRPVAIFTRAVLAGVSRRIASVG